MNRIPRYIWKALITAIVLCILFIVETAWAQNNGGHEAELGIFQVRFDWALAVITVVASAAIAYGGLLYHIKNASIHVPRHEVVTRDICQQLQEDLGENVKKEIRIAVLEGILVSKVGDGDNVRSALDKINGS